MRYLLHHTVDAATEHAPEAEAFRCWEASLTYGALAAQTNALARLLRDQGVVRGDRVGILMDKCVETALAVFGVMKAGAAFVPLDAGAPAARTADMIQQAGIRHLITHRPKHRTVTALSDAGVSLQGLLGLPEPPEGLAAVHAQWADLDAWPDHPLHLRQTDSDLAYIMFTSGSTGPPKGIMHTHRSGLSYARMAAHTYDLRPSDRVSGHSPLHFDMSTLGYFASPYAGAATVLVPEAYMKLPASLSQLIQDERLTVWYSVPLALTQLRLRGVLDQRDASALRWVLFGGEPFPPKHLYALMQQWPQARFSNVYGPAEVNQCTYYHLPPPTSETDTEAPIPLGTVWDNTEVRIVDADDQPVPDGQPGELLVRTSTMMQGYWDRPRLNAQAFYTEPSTTPPAVYYRTGDLVLRGPDGLLQYLGRKDRQIKMRGYRVELDEIENALLTHPAVEEAAAYAVAEPEGGHRIEGAVILRTTPAPKPEAHTLRNHLIGQLPAYAVPTHVRLCPTFPRTTSGKIDRRALRVAAEAAASDPTPPS